MSIKPPFPPCPDVAQTSEEERLASMKRRVEVRRYYINAKIDRVIRSEVTQKNLGGEELRIWLERFTKTGVGLDICCGNFLIAETGIGVDSAYNVVGNDYNFKGDDLTSFNRDSMNYIVCNYFDCFDSPLKVLNEWYRVIKNNGVMAIVCSNADCYPENGSLLNGKRCFLYTPHTIKQYVTKVFGNCAVKVHKTFLLVTATKTEGIA